MDVQSAANLNIPEGSVRNIHDKDKRLLWSAVGYNVRYDGDTTQQTYTGKNLIDFKLSNLNERYTSVTENNGIFTMTATSTNLPRVTISTTSSLVVGNTYTLSAYIRARSVTNGYTYMRMRETVGGGDWIPSVPSQQSISVSSDFVKYSLTFTATVSNPAIWFYLSSLASQTILADFDVKDVQIEAGSTATTYEQYVGGSPAPNPDYPQDVNVVQGHQVVTVKDKNLLIVPNDSYSSNGIDWVRNGNSKIHGSGTLSSYTWSNTGSTAMPLNLPPGTYTFSIKNPLPSPLQIEFATFDNDSVRRNYQIPVNSTSTTRDFPNGLKSTTVAVVRGVIGDYYDITIENVQIEAGSTATAFEQPQSKTFTVGLGPIELCKIGNYQDYIYKGADGWYVHKDIGKIVLDGSNDENWGISYPGTSNYFYRYKYLTNFVYDGSNSPWVNNIAVHGSVGSTTTVEGSMITNIGEIRIRYGAEMPIADWLSKLATTNMILYYGLATPTNTKITDTTITSQLDAIHDWLTRYDYYGNVTGNLPMIINRTGLT